MSKPQHQNARYLSTRPTLAFLAVAFCVASLAEDASAQGIVRRLGTRIRETVQQRTAQPPATPPAPAAPAPATRTPTTRTPASLAPASQSRTSNYNPAQNRPESRKPNPAPRPLTAGPALATPLSPAKSSSSVSSMAKQPVVASQRPTVAARARLGLIVETPPPTTIPGKPSRPTRGALVVGTEPGSGSEASGMMPGDLVVAIDGRTVIGVDDLVARLGELNPGDPVELKFVRNQKLSATTALMADPTGKLAPEDYAALKEITASDAKSSVASVDEEKTSDPTSAIGGLGRALGGWLAGGTKTPARANDSKSSGAAGPFDPLTQQSPEPLEGGVVQIDYEALRMKTDEDQSSLPPVTPTDPPSLNPFVPEATPEASDESMELLPAPTEVAPNDQQPGGEASLKPESSIEQSTIQSLLKELELLRQRIEQLEAEKAAPSK